MVTHGDGKGFSGGYTISEKGELCGQSKQEDGIKSFIHGTIVRQKLHGSTGVSGFFELGAGFVAERKAPAKKQKAPPILIDSEQVLPRFTETPDISGGTLEVRIKNGQPFPLTVGFRAGQTGRNLWIPSGGLASIQLPAGKFDVFYQYDPEPEALYQGESIVLNYNGVEILIGPAVEAGRTIKKVK